MADSSTTQQKTAHTPIPGADEKNASLKLFLSADSGYHAETEYRVSANQWAAILQIGEETAALGAAAWVADPKVKESLRSFHETTRVLKAAALAAAPDTAAERDRLRTYAHDATKAITGLVGGGSECFGRKIGDIYLADLPFCEARLRERAQLAHEHLLDRVKAAKAAEA
jgi:hypothetical protein